MRRYGRIIDNKLNHSIIINYRMANLKRLYQIVKRWDVESSKKDLVRYEESEKIRINEQLPSGEGFYFIKTSLSFLQMLLEL
jgi:hypothetical protein